MDDYFPQGEKDEMQNFLIVSEPCISSPMNRRGIGGSLYCMIKAQKNFTVDLLYLDEKDPESEEEMRRYFRNIYHVDAKKDPAHGSRILSALKGRPRLVGSYDLKKIAFAGIPLEEYDGLIYNTVSVLGLSPLFAGRYQIAFMIDSMSMFYERRSRREHGIRSLYSRMQARLMQRYTEEYIPIMDKLVYVSKVDCEYEKRRHPAFSDKFCYVNNGVFRREIQDTPGEQGMGLSLVFSGIMTYPPNKDAALFLAREIFPGLRGRFRGIRLYLVGKDPDAEILACGSEDVIVTGKVPSVYAYMKGASLYVSPLPYGSGMKNKLLEAMACRKAIVASPVSVEGIRELQNGKNIDIVTGGAAEWIQHIASLLSDPVREESYAAQCIEIIRKDYSWDDAFRKLVSDGRQA